MGEIGLISFKGKTINQRIRECQSQDEFNELLGLLVSMIIQRYILLQGKHHFPVISTVVIQSENQNLSNG